MTTASHPIRQANLSIVKEPTETAVEAVEGTVVEHQGQSTRPGWVEAATARATAAKDHMLDNKLYAPWAGRGYRNLARRWLEAYRDDHPQMIASAKAERKAAKGDTSAEAGAHDLVKERRTDYRRHKWIHLGKTAAWSAVGAAGAATGAIVGGTLVEVVMGGVAYAVGVCNGRPEPETPVLTLAEQVAIQQAAQSEAPALTEERLAEAINGIGFRGGIQVLSSTPWGADRTATTVFDLPPGVTVTALKKKEEALAGFLGLDSSMIDITKAGAAGRASLWMTDRDPFEAPRPSPLLDMRGGLDAFKDGVPVAFSKRGVAINLVVNNSSFVIAGMTRSGKGVGAANLIAGAAMDVRINLRVVAGKTNGEWDAGAKAGVLATYFKPNPQRLLALINAEIAEMNRRNKILGDLGKSKMTAETINRLGGIEVLVIDELATFTRPGLPLRDEILEALIKLSAVAAGAGILLVLITQYPEVDVIPQGLAMNCGTRWAMRVDNATQSNAILGGSASSAGRDASKFDPPMPGLGWLVNPFAGVTDKARSFDLDEDERGEVTELMQRAAQLREAAGRLVGQWEDPIERALLNATGLSSAAGGPKRNGEPGLEVLRMTPEQKLQLDAVLGALDAMDQLGRDVAQLDEMAELIGDMTGERLSELLRAAGAGGTIKVTIPGRGRVNGYRWEDIAGAAKYLQGD
ncbi:FtsK/SpoIIIE domain-containing protein [Streptomyces antimycoticus]|uniref:FtsK/SpoIIIE domain-containing protein n=1 Tax=Streptomyces antimycoticus TaxID=68175 RepID=UPI00386B2741|nr:FtsK/SpoIIIE domain-containing protein [Streptomyces antimycoticus]